MSATNQNQEIDSLKIVENADGTFSMEWDKADPKWKFFEWVDICRNSGYYGTSNQRGTSKS
jgi:hypothetical protein